jgi:CheY-like chemotaxis protein
LPVDLTLRSQFHFSLRIPQVISGSTTLPGWHVNCVYFERWAILVRMVHLTNQIKSVDKEFKILIADRNRNVRNLLQRELLDAGYQVILAGEDRELIRLLHDEHAADLLILDPDLPSSLSISELITLLHGCKPTLPIVIYTFLDDGLNYRELPGVAMCLEKKEDINHLKEGVTQVITKYYSPCPP